MVGRTLVPPGIALAALLSACLAGAARGEDLPEPPDFPWEKGGLVRVGEQNCRVFPPGLFPEYEALQPQVPPEKNAARWYLAAIQCWVDPQREWFDLRPGQAEWERAKPLVAKWLAQNARAWAYLDRAAELPAARWPMLWSVNAKPAQVLPYLALLPQLAKLRQFARGRALLARLALDAGKPEEALRHVRAGSAIGRQHTGGFLIEGLVAVACDGIAMDALEDLLCSARLDAAQLAALAEFLDARRATLDPGVNVMKGEELLSLQTLDMYLAGKLYGTEFMQDFKPSEELADLLSSRAARIVLPDRTMRAHFTMVYSATREQMQRPYWETHKDGEALADPVAAIPPWDFMARLLLPAMGRIGASYARRTAGFDMARTAVALKRALLDTGVRPAKLADLVPKYLMEVPVDPFTGKALGYITAPGEWRVYSVGPDQKDNHAVRTQLANGESDLVFYLEDAPGRRPKPNAPPPPPTEKPPVPEPPPTTPEEF